MPVSQCFIYKMGMVVPRDPPGDFLKLPNEREAISKQIRQQEHIDVCVIFLSSSESFFLLLLLYKTMDFSPVFLYKYFLSIKVDK